MIVTIDAGRGWLMVALPLWDNIISIAVHRALALYEN